jgi:serine O-acetyltransferase
MMTIIGGQVYLNKQIKKHIALLHDLSGEETNVLDSSFPDVLLKVEQCWAEIADKYYSRNGEIILDINNSNQHTQFLLILAHDLSQKGHKVLADKFFALNKMMNGCDIYHEVILPRSFLINHSIGIVIGRAQIGENFYVSQNCTVGAHPGSTTYPTLGNHNYLMANVMIVGNVKVGDRVIFAAGAYVKDIEIPSDSIVFGQAPNTVIKLLKTESFKMASYFKQA